MLSRYIRPVARTAKVASNLRVAPRTLAFSPFPKFYSSSSSSSAKRKQNAAPVNKQSKVPFVSLNYTPRDFAHCAFFALDRPLILVPVWDSGRQVLQCREEEEYDEDSFAITPSTSRLINNSSSQLTNGSSTIDNNDATSTLLSSLQPSVTSMTPAESQQIVNRFLTEIESKFKKMQESKEESVELQKERVQERKKPRLMMSARQLLQEQEKILNNKRMSLPELQSGIKRDEMEMPHKATAAVTTTMSMKSEETEIYHLTNIRQKRRLKMNKHKHRKLRKRQRALRRRLGK